MKIGLISDVHGNSPALHAVLAALRDVELIFFMGDFVGYYPFVNECSTCWDTDRITGVLGNHDQLLLNCLHQGEMPGSSYCDRYGSALARSLKDLSPEARALVESWPQHRTLEPGGLSVAMFHGAPWDPLEGRVYPDFADWSRFEQCREEVILLGHTHYPMVQRWHGKTIINPGSVGQPRRSSGAAEFAVLDTSAVDVEFHRAQYDAGEVIADARRHDPRIAYLAEVLTR